MYLYKDSVVDKEKNQNLKHVEFLFSSVRMLLHGNGQILFLVEICSHFSDSFPSHGTLRDLTFKYMKDSAYTFKFDASTDSCFLIVFMEKLKEGSLSLTEN